MTRTPPTKQSGKTDPPPRRGRAAAVTMDAGFAAAQAFARAGFTDPSLVLHWREIAGPEIARIARPLKFREGPSGGVLILMAEPGAALFLGHDARALRQRINAYLGRDAVIQVKFVQAALSQRPEPPPPRKAGPAPETQDPVYNFKGPAGLGMALRDLARWRARRQKS
jgi:hypothetical protein